MGFTKVDKDGIDKTLKDLNLTNEVCIVSPITLSTGGTFGRTADLHACKMFSGNWKICQGFQGSWVHKTFWGICQGGVGSKGAVRAMTLMKSCVTLHDDKLMRARSHVVTTFPRVRSKQRPTCTWGSLRWRAVLRKWVRCSLHGLRWLYRITHDLKVEMVIMWL